MLNHIRLILITMLMGLFLVACGDESSSEQATTEEAPAATESAAMVGDIEEGMTEEQAIAKLGQPTISQTRTIDSLTITHHEWHNKDGVTSIQFQNGKAKYIQVLPAE